MNVESRDSVSLKPAELDEFGMDAFMGEWESLDECIEWYADDYLNPSLPTDDPIDDEDDEEADQVARVAEAGPQPAAAACAAAIA